MNRPGWLIQLAALLVPAERREEWRREWLAELHYAQSLADEARSFAFARGAFHDAIWQQRDFWNLKRTRRLLQSPAFCLGALAAPLLAVILFSGLLPSTRQALLPLPYRDPGQIVLIAQDTTFATRGPEPVENIAAWRKSSQALESIATYRWEKGQNIAAVSENFFSLLGVNLDLRGCDTEPCVVLSPSGSRGGLRPNKLSVNGKSYRVAGVTPHDFWFLSPKIKMWRIENFKKNSRAGVVARLRAGVSAGEASTELTRILRDAGVDGFEALVEFTSLSNRVRSVFVTFGFGVFVSLLIILPTLRARMPNWNPRAAGFFLAKTGLLLATVMLTGIEFTRANSITMLGGSDGYTAFSAWLFVMGSTGALAWSIMEQRQRCRVCLKRLGMAAHVGCPGCLLLDWAGTELVCVEGHGMLHVPEMAASWQEPEKWTFLDETWQELFVERSAVSSTAEPA